MNSRVTEFFSEETYCLEKEKNSAVTIAVKELLLCAGIMWLSHRSDK